RSCRCAPLCSDTSSSIKASARTRTASRRKSTFAPVLPSSSSSAIIKLVAMIGTSLRCVLPTRMEPDCGHFCQEGDHILEFTPLPGTLTEGACAGTKSLRGLAARSSCSPKCGQINTRGDPIMSSQPVKAGVIGLGRSGWYLHALVMKGMPDRFEVTAVSDPLEERRNEAVQELGCTAYADPEQLIHDDRIELVVVATPSHTHADLAV